MAGNNNGRLTNAIGESLSPAAIKLTVPPDNLTQGTAPMAVAIHAMQPAQAGAVSLCSWC